MTTIWNGIEVLVNLFQMFIIFKIFEIFYELRFKNKNLLNLTIIIMAILLTVVNHIVVIKDDIMVYFAVYMFLYIIAISIFKGNIITKTCLIAFILLVIGSCELAAAAIIMIITKIDISNSYEQGFYRLSIIIISQTIIFYIYLIIKYKIKIENIFIAKKGYYILISAILIVNIIALIIVLWMYGNLHFVDNINNIYMFIITVCIIVLSILEFILFNKIIKNAKQEADKDKLIFQYEIENKHYSQISEILEDMRIIKHNLKNSLIIIDAYNKSNQKDKLQKYIDELLDKTNVFVVPQIDEENIITSYLNYKTEQAKSNNIKVSIQNNLTQTIKIEKSDICQVVGNIMDNAIEANEKNSNKFIELNMYNKHNYLIITSKNPINEPLLKKDDIIPTTKNDIANHGFGIKSIKKITEKYEGTVEIETTEQLFTIKVIFLNE